jgi:hypothetical protein
VEPALVLANVDPAFETEYLAADVVLVLANVDPAIGAEYLAAWATTAIVVLTAGESTTTRISAVGQMLRQAGLAIPLAILVGADRDDDSFGVIESEGVDDDSASLGLLRATPG